MTLFILKSSLKILKTKVKSADKQLEESSEILKEVAQGVG
jgi:hypothetical protein